MCGGGGGQTQEDRSLEVEAMRQREREENRAREEARQAQERDERAGRFSRDFHQAVDGFRTNAQRRIANRGLDYNEFAGTIEDAIKGAAGRIPELDPNPGQFFGDSLIDNSLNEVQQGRRTQFTRQARNKFADDEPNSLFADSSDDNIINAILGRQRSEASSALEMARKRGNLDNQGFDAAMARLGEMEKAGRSTAQTLGGSVLSNYRTQLRNVRDDAIAGAGNYQLGDNFDLANFRNRFDNQANDFRGRLEGDVNAALTGQQFFDLGDIITRGGVAQGVTNPTIGLSDILAERERVRNANRGVTSPSSGGTF